MKEKTVETPWITLQSGVLYRYTAGGTPDETLTIPMGGAQARYLMLGIWNGDDPELKYTGAKATRLVEYVAFPAKTGRTYTLYVRNPNAESPSYDLVRFVDRLRKEGVRPATLGSLAPNPGFKEISKELPWSERYKWLIWIALAAVALVLGSLIWKQLKSVPPAANEGDKS